VPDVNFQCAPTHRNRPLPRVIVLCMGAPVQTSSVSRQVAVGPAAARAMPGRVAPAQPTPEFEGPGTAAPAIRPSHQHTWQQHPGRSCEATTVSPLDARTGPPTRSIRTDVRSRSFADGRVDNPAGRLSADPKAVGCPLCSGGHTPRRRKKAGSDLPPVPATAIPSTTAEEAINHRLQPHFYHRDPAIQRHDPVGHAPETIGYVYQQASILRMT
jgi:hypothetical protein